MTIGIIGAGEMGCCLAAKFIQSGHSVSMANSRGPASLQQLAGNIGAKAATVAEVIQHHQVIVVAIPQKNVPQLPIKLFATLKKDVVVIDTGNYYPHLRDGVLPALDQSGIDSLWTQEQLGFPVVKVFNSILATSIAGSGKPKGDVSRIALAVSGDETAAKERVFALVDKIGFDVADLGDIRQSWKQQPGSPIYCRDITLAALQQRVKSMGTAWSVMRKTILAKRASDEALMRADYPAYLATLQQQ